MIKLFGGIEGGGTKTILSLFNEQGELIHKETTGTTNPWLLGRESSEDGFTVAARRIYDLIKKAMNFLSNENDANKPVYNLEAVGMCLSGAGCKAINNRITDAILKFDVQYKVFVGNDSLAALYTACDNGGLVVISGTGSKCVLVNPVSDFKKLQSFDDIICYSTGGWGNLLGDEGSAYWISQKSIKYVIDYNDNFFQLEDESDKHKNLDNEVEQLKEIIFKHFEVETLDDLLPHFYSHFKKDFIAGLTAKLAKNADKNSVIKHIFDECGYQLARHIVAIEPKLDKDLLSLPGGIPIVCAGSVFKSWNLIKTGFVKCLENPKYKNLRLKELKLVAVKDDSTIGAAILASRLNDQESKLCKHINVSNLINVLDHIIIPSQISRLDQKVDHNNKCNKLAIDQINESLVKEA